MSADFHLVGLFLTRGRRTGHPHDRWETDYESGLLESLHEATHYGHGQNATHLRSRHVRSD